MRQPITRLPLILALMLTGINAIKPITVDDTAYLRFARQIAEHPGDPYGFTWGWYYHDQPAFEILSPPILPYYLALCIRLVGDEPWRIKLALLPLAWLFAFAVSRLCSRFTPGVERPVLILATLSPWVVPAWNLMLDLPAMALMLTGLHLAFRAMDESRIRIGLVAGVLLALAMQTKYTAFVGPGVVILYGMLHQRYRVSLIVALIGILGFSFGEFLIALRYGESHFLYHLRHPMIWQGQPVNGLRQKVEMLPPLLAQFGGLGSGLLLMTLFALGIGRNWRYACITCTIVSVTMIGLIGGESIVFPMMAITVTAGCITVMITMMRRKHRSRYDLFLILWWSWEFVAMVWLSPFPAARRGIGLSIVSFLLVGRLARHRRHSREWLPVVAFGVMFTAFITIVDQIDARVEPRAVRETIADIRTIDPDGRIWFLGRWGFQYEAERLGLSRLDATRDVLEPGDWLILPELRPVRPTMKLDETQMEWQWQKEWTWPLGYRTIPEYYAGRIPYAHHQGPQIRVDVYRMTHRWKPQGFTR